MYKKPWGKEALVFQNKNVALWHLFINPWQETSLHCHPNKKTGLIVLKECANVSFLTGDIVKLFAGEKVMIRQGVFHQTKNMSDHILELFEIETPVDKGDLIRIEDRYNRGEKYGIEETEIYECLYPWECHSKYLEITYGKFKLGSCAVEYSLQISSIPHHENGNYMFLSKGIFTKDNICVCGPGDIMSAKSLSSLSEKFNLDTSSEVIKIYQCMT